MANRALIIANQNFADLSIPSLSSPLSDGRRLKSLLERDDVGSYDVQICENASSLDARHAIQEFFDVGQPEDLQLLVISTHGLKDRWSRLYFATADTRKAMIAASSLESRFIRERMDDSSAGRKVLIIDACYSGAFLEGMVYKKGEEPSISREDFGSFSAGGTTIITASSTVQMASEKNIDGSMQSVFTRCMIEGIETGAADTSADGLITLTELYEYVSRRLKIDAPGQTPQWLDTSQGGTVVIARNPAFRSATLPDELLARMRSRDRAARITAAEDLETIARSGSRESDLARDALNVLATDDSVAVRQVAFSIVDRLNSGAAMTTPASSRSIEIGKAVNTTIPDNSLRKRLLVAVVAIAGLIALVVVIAALSSAGKIPAADDSNSQILENASNIADDSGTSDSPAQKAYDLGAKEYAAKDYPAALRDFKTACDGGEARGCNDLAVMYGKAEGVLQDSVQAVELYRRACDGGNMLGCSNLGTMYDNENGVTRDYGRAAELYRRSCDGGGMQGCAYLGTMYENGSGVAQDNSRAVELYRKSCDGSELLGCAFLGTMYENEKGVPRDYAKAVELYRKACDGDNITGCGYLGTMYDNGKGVVLDYGRALELYRKGCDGGNTASCVNLGANYDDAQGVPRNYFRAVEFYRKGCDGGNASGCAFLAEKYEYARGVAKDRDKAVLLYRQALRMSPDLEFAKQGLSRLGETY